MGDVGMSMCVNHIYPQLPTSARRRRGSFDAPSVARGALPCLGFRGRSRDADLDGDRAALPPDADRNRVTRVDEQRRGKGARELGPASGATECGAVRDDRVARGELLPENTTCVSSQ